MRKASAAVIATAFAVVLAIVALLFTDVASETVPEVEVSGSPAAAGEFRLTLSFGLSRLPITRTVVLSLCPPERPARFPECAPAADEEEVSARPESTSAGVVADLQKDGDAQFPADQLSVVAANEGAEGLRITVTADPRQPERVDAGTYEGTLLVERSEGPPVHFAMAVALAAREGAISAKAVFFLFLGAFFGGAVKWLNDMFAPLSGLRRRLRRFARLLRPDLAYLPTPVTRSLDDLRASIRALDSEGVAERLAVIEQGSGDLAEFAAAVKALQRELDVQAALIERTSDQRLRTFLARQQHKLDALRARSWPWEDAAQVFSDCRALQEEFEQATDRLQGVPAANQLELTTLAEELGAAPDGAAEQALIEAEAHADERMQAREREADVARSFSERLLDNAWWILLLVAALVITAVGYQTQYVDNDAYEGDARDIAKLVAWAFALQLAGTTLLEAVGRLSPRSTSG